MENSNNTKNYPERKPIQSLKFRRSKDRKYVMVDVVTTYILPANYIAAIARNAEAAADVSEAS